jgi:ribonuclease G
VNKELIINSAADGVEIALLEDKKLVEIHNEKMDARWAVGDLYLGKVKKIIPGLNAAFVDVGFEKDAFLHYTDLSPYVKSIIQFTHQAVNDNNNSFDFTKFETAPEIVKTGKISEVLNGKPSIMVQILKEPIAAKGPRLTCELSLAGRFVVLTPFNDMVAVSKKIHSGEERKRLQKIIEAIKPKNFGVIVRTAAEGQSTAELHEDLLSLIANWTAIQKNLKGAVAPTRIMSEESKTNSILRDLLNEDFNKIVVNDKKVYDHTLNYLQRIAPQKTNILSLHNTDNDIFDQYGITKQVKSGFGKTVNLPSGAYLIIEENALQTNMEAAEEIARQLRLRDLGGIIVIDFIDMKLPENKKKVQEALEGFMKTDRARHTVLPISKFGLLQATRQRIRPEVNINTSEDCPACSGTGKITSTLLLEDEMEKKLAYLATHGHKSLVLLVHPIIHSHLTKGLFTSIIKRWKKKYKIKLKSQASNASHLVEYQFLDSHQEPIVL